MTQPIPPEGSGVMPARTVDMYTKYLSYSDVSPTSKADQINYLETNQNAQRYAGELGIMMDKYGEVFLVGEANKAVSEMKDMLKTIGIEPTKYANSQSWFLWHAAKMRYLANNPVVRAGMANTDQYDPVDPFLHTKEEISADQAAKSQKARDEILYTHLGWELAPKAVADTAVVTRNLDPTTPAVVRQEIEALASEWPEAGRDSLSSYKLCRLGELVWTHQIGVNSK